MSLRALPRSTSASLRPLYNPQRSIALRRPSTSFVLVSSRSSSLPRLQHRSFSLTHSSAKQPSSLASSDDDLLPAERRRKRKEELIKEAAEKERLAQNENASKLLDILNRGAGAQYEMVQVDKNLPLPGELYWNPPPFYKKPSISRIALSWQNAQLLRNAYEGTTIIPSILKTLRYWLPLFPRSEKSKQTDKELISSATESLTRYLETRASCDYTQLDRYATHPMLTEATSLARRNFSPDRAQRKLTVDVSSARLVSFVATAIAPKAPQHNFAHALVQFTYTMTLSRPNSPPETSAPKTRTFLFERRSWARDLNWKIRREIKDQDLEIQHVVPPELLTDYMNPAEWDGVKKIAGKPLKKQD